MNNKPLLALVCVPFIALAIWVGSIETKYINAPRVYVAVTGYDPRDLLSGHYLNLRIVWEKTDCNQFEEKVCPEYDFDYNYRFYLSENDAMYLDRVIPRNDLDMKLEFAYLKNVKPLIKELYIEGKPWKTWIKENPDR